MRMCRYNAGSGLRRGIADDGYVLDRDEPAERHPLELLSDSDRALLCTLGVKIASLDAAAPHGVRDLDGRLSAWLADHDAQAVLVRPDFYVFGSVAAYEELPALVEDLRSQLRMTSTPAISGAPV